MGGEQRVPGLGSLEVKIMRIAWERGGRFVLVRDVLELLVGELAYTTVMTVMNRLHEKGLLQRRREGRAWSYRAATTREAYVAASMADALDGAGNRTSALLHFVADLDDAESSALRRLLRSDEAT